MNDPTQQRVPSDNLPDELKINLEAAKQSLTGTLVGDSLGLPYEGQPAGRNLRLMPFPLRQRLCFGKGFPSDDTLQSVFVLQALIACQGSEERFVRGFGRRLRTWFLSIPPGVGLSTVKACLRLCLGVNPLRSGVRSAGNGAAMRAAVLGAALCDCEKDRVRFVEICCRVTHTDPLAIQGAQIIAFAASLSSRQKREDFEPLVRAMYPDWPWEKRWPERGPSGWVVHSVNAAIELWQKHVKDRLDHDYEQFSACHAEAARARAEAAKLELICACDETRIRSQQSWAESSALTLLPNGRSNGSRSAAGPNQVTFQPSLPALPTFVWRAITFFNCPWCFVTDFAASCLRSSRRLEIRRLQAVKPQLHRLTTTPCATAPRHSALPTPPAVPAR